MPSSRRANPSRVQSLELALSRNSTDIDLLLRYSHALCELERREEALALAEQALALHPSSLRALNVRGLVLERLGRYQEALECFQRILTAHAEDIDAINNRGMIYGRSGNWAGALAEYDRSLTLRAAQPQAIYNRSIVRLALGDWERGLREFEGRWQVPPLAGKRPSTAPLWLGQESLEERTLFVHHEQGFGDSLQCARYLRELVGLGARVVLGVPQPLLRLLRTAHEDIAVTSSPAGTLRHDFQCPLMSLLVAFGTTPRSICGGAPYLRAHPSEVAAWRRRLGPKRRPRIGIAWSGRQHTPINYPRDLSLDLLSPLLALDADFVCLQTEMAAADRDRVGIHRNLDTKSAATLTDFADTAALIENMDWVICADTAVAHLAGALGKTAWLMNRYASCWRWMQEGERTPWYPNMTIFRQQRLGDWKTVVDAIRAAALKKFVELPGS